MGSNAISGARLSTFNSKANHPPKMEEKKENPLKDNFLYKNATLIGTTTLAGAAVGARYYGVKGAVFGAVGGLVTGMALSAYRGSEGKWFNPFEADLKNPRAGVQGAIIGTATAAGAVVGGILGARRGGAAMHVGAAIGGTGMFLLSKAATDYVINKAARPGEYTAAPWSRRAITGFTTLAGAAAGWAIGARFKSPIMLGFTLGSAGTGIGHELGNYIFGTPPQRYVSLGTK